MPKTCRAEQHEFYAFLYVVATAFWELKSSKGEKGKWQN